MIPKRRIKHDTQKIPKMTKMRSLVALMAALYVAMSAMVAVSDAVCCERNLAIGSLYCCGKGPCNIFCCNCDNDCNEPCEATNCNALEWAKCGGILTACGAICLGFTAASGGTAFALCAACLGPSAAACFPCSGLYENRRRELGLLEQREESGRAGFFHEIDTDNSGGISKAEFDAYKQKTGNEDKQGECWTFADWDDNNDGIIDEWEFSNSECSLSPEEKRERMRKLLKMLDAADNGEQRGAAERRAWDLDMDIAAADHED